jgi:hypothetical protein
MFCDRNAVKLDACHIINQDGDYLDAHPKTPAVIGKKLTWFYTVVSLVFSCIWVFTQQVFLIKPHFSSYP